MKILTIISIISITLLIASVCTLVADLFITLKKSKQKTFKCEYKNISFNDPELDNSCVYEYINDSFNDPKLDNSFKCEYLKNSFNDPKLDNSFKCTNTLFNIQEMDNNEIKIGRSVLNDIILDYPEVSRKHAIIYINNGAWCIKDLSSSNGVIINHSVIPLYSSIKLADGDEIILGGQTLKISITNETLIIKHTPSL